MLVKEEDLLHYCTLVFKNLENNPPFGKSYIMVVVFPNWQSRIPEEEEVGYLNYEEVNAGDSYFNIQTQCMEKYNYSNLIFKKFVKEDNSKKENIYL